MARAQARIDADKSKSESGDKAADTGASGPAKEEGKGADESGKAKGAEVGDTPIPGSVVAPADWSEDRRKAFDALPDDNARQQVLDMHKDFQAGFTRVTQEVADIVKSHGTLLNAMQEHGASGERVVELLTLSRMFDENPRNVIEELAKQKGVQVWFEQPLAPGEIPKFETDAEMAEWMRAQARKEAEATLKAEREAADKKSKEDAARVQQEDARKALKAEFDKANSLPDFAAHRPAVVEMLSRAPSLSVEEAYHLATLPALRKAAEDGAKAMQELAALKAKSERAAKDATRPVEGKQGTEVPEADKQLTPAERAMKRAEARMAAAKA
jgi:hypothetical protein